ncbi:hypothetical protein IQ273_19135 [Nodosilinea sp. LEGE 07298]|uniref:COR domain-containing protein n=1 Tax=Nodosilinea sp. LEGE 07298 TaxID=2777970 RepID=UPI001882D1D4|nr:COR domain-containing protein [Nodosilinea sp. LEGE 07298]MBE9111523.1 hypothetical protein [Nodosilinea sp. LEGE 07298]
MTQDELLQLIGRAATEGRTELDLAGQGLTALPSQIGELTHLWQLDLRSNQLSVLPPEIGRLSTLKQLDLSSNRLSVLLPEIGQLTNLRQLNLRANQLSVLPPEIGRLTKLQQIDLSSNQLSALPPEIGQLANLQQLSLSSNRLSVLPPEIGQLTSLQQLSLRWNQLSALPPEIGQLTSLQQLSLNSNKLSTLPLEIGQLTSLHQLYLDNEQIEAPPPEILNEGTSSIVNYLRQQLEQGKDYIYEAKFLIVGEGGAGKTSLAHKIIDPSYELNSEEQSTEGIDVIRWTFNLRDGKPFQVNIWDFGGQEIYHATHQFFLTKRSLYVLLVDTRQDNTDLYYWLSIIELLSAESPVIIVKNEKQDRTCKINERQLRAEFISLKETLSTNLRDNRGLADIQEKIKQYIFNLPHIGTPLPKKWVDVRKALENDERDHISIKEYYEICKYNGFDRQEDRLQLSEYLHDLGVFLHFQNDPLLKKIIILKPEWSTTAVYKALDTREVRNNFGRFTRTQLDDIWSESQYIDLRDELLHLMMRFKLCYQIPGTIDQYIAPQLLEVEKPTYNWDDSQNLLLRYEYEFMPKGILTRFIVEMHKSIEDQTLVWKSGVVLTNGAARAEVIELYHNREIQIRVSGTRSKELLTIVSHEIDKINESYERIRVKKLIPCNCNICKENDPPQFFTLEVLNRFAQNEQEKIQCQSSFEMVNVRRLIQDTTSFYNRDAKPDRREFNSNIEISSPTRQKEELPVQTLPDAQKRRLALFNTLKGLPNTQFEQLIFMLDAPTSNVGNSSAPQGERVPKLLEWAKSDMGCGLEAVERAIAAINTKETGE